MKLNNNNWMLINTNHATFNIFEKTIVTKEKVFVFYDDGTKLESSGLNYNVESERQCILLSRQPIKTWCFHTTGDENTASSASMLSSIFRSSLSMTSCQL